MHKRILVDVTEESRALAKSAAAISGKPLKVWVSEVLGREASRTIVGRNLRRSP